MCYHSYDRLIDLAQRTGDRLIVHDPIEGRDIVIMDVNEYEKIIYNCGQNFNEFDFNHRHDIRRMSSDEMLDQINRDIAIWRAEKEDEDQWSKEMALKEEFANEPPFDPFSECDYHPSEWHDYPEDWKRRPDPWYSAGSVLDDRYSDLYDNGDEDDFDWEDLDSDEEDVEVDLGPFDWNEENGFELEDDLDFFNKDNSEDGEEIKVEDIPFDSGLNFETEKELKEIPLSDISEVENSWEEEPLGDDEPVFYEEPV